MSRQLTAFAVEFKRDKHTPWEQGLYVGRHEADDEYGTIFDMDGRIIKAPIWDYRDYPMRGCLVLRGA